MMQVLVTLTTGAMICAKLQSNYHHQQTNTQLFLQAGFPSGQQTNSVKALKGNYKASCVANKSGACDD